MDFKWTLSGLYRDFAILTTKMKSSQYRESTWTLSGLYRDFAILTTKMKSSQYREST